MDEEPVNENANTKKPLSCGFIPTLADMIKVLAIFEVTEVRPLIDFGQGR
jgi:hypothetical protein